LIGSSHNRAPMPFNREIGNTIVYQATKPANWQPGDYTKWTEPITSPNNDFGNYKILILFIRKTNNKNFQVQKQDLSSSSSFIVPNSNNSTIYKTPSQSIQRLSSTSSQNPRGVDSLSMRMLNSNLSEIQGSESF
jgi:hypothetical protein